MSEPAKLRALRATAADERTPIDEARNAALAYVRKGGALPRQEDPELRRELESLRQEAAGWRERATRAEAMVRDFERQIREAMRAESSRHLDPYAVPEHDDDDPPGFFDDDDHEVIPW